MASERIVKMRELRDAAQRAALEWTAKMAVRNPRIMHAETVAFARGYEEGWRRRGVEEKRQEAKRATARAAARATL